MTFRTRDSDETRLWLGLPPKLHVLTVVAILFPIPLWLASQFLKSEGTGLEEVCVFLVGLYYFPPLLLGAWTPFGELLLERNQFLLWPNWAGVCWSAFVYGFVLIAPPAVYRRILRRSPANNQPDG